MGRADEQIGWNVMAAPLARRDSVTIASKTPSVGARRHGADMC
jgi:hypothetical protein